MINCTYLLASIFPLKVFVSINALLVLVLFIFVLLKLCKSKLALFGTALVLFGSFGNFSERVLKNGCVYDSLNFGIFWVNFYDISICLGLLFVGYVLYHFKDKNSLKGNSHV